MKTSKIVGIIIASVVGVIGIAVGVTFLLRAINQPKEVVKPTEEPPAVVVENTDAPEQIDLQLAVNQWIDTQESDNWNGIIIYDADNKAVVARHNENKTFKMPMIYQMFIAYEGYYLLDKKTWNGEELYADLNLTKAQCLDQMVRWADTNCTNALYNEIGITELQNVFNAKGFSNTSISTMQSTPTELMQLYWMFYKHTDFADGYWDTIRQTMLNQGDEPHGINFRAGLPAGFTVAKVYNKTGWYSGNGVNWDNYDDAALVYFPETQNKDGSTIKERHYIVIAMTENTAPEQLVALGKNIESAVRTHDNY